MAVNGVLADDESLGDLPVRHPLGEESDDFPLSAGQLAERSRIWAYGAAGKATLWLNACDMDYLEAMVDASPLRAGKLMPGVHTPIHFR